MHTKILPITPDWCGSVDLARKAKGHWFDSQTGHRPGLRARSPIRARTGVMFYSDQ